MRDTETADTADAGEFVSLCSLRVDDRTFGIETSMIREVLGKCSLTRVPLAPACIGGVIAYRGDVLTTLSLRALLGMPPGAGEGRVLVLDEAEQGERFGLLVDNVGGVITLPCRSMDTVPGTLQEPMRSLFRGAFRTGPTLLVQLDPGRLRPSDLREIGLFCRQANGLPKKAGDNACAL